jgi:hypothetical protein
MDDTTGENTSMLLNRRDGPLAKQLANKLSIVANTNTAMYVKHNFVLRV